MPQVPKGRPTLFVAQEFLDALPVHQFQYTENGWRERLVDINVPGAGGESADGAAGGDADADGNGNGGGGEAQKKKAEPEPDFR